MLARVRDLTRLPKAHLHVHLESTIRWSTLRDIGRRNAVPVPDPPAGPFAGFRAFADYNTLVRESLHRPEDFRRVALEFCQDEAAEGTGYAEVSFTAASHGERLGRLDMPLQAVIEGLAEGRSRFGIECRLILDHSRRRSAERAWRTLELARAYAADGAGRVGVVAVGVAGDEAYSLGPFAGVFDAAREAGLHVVHHAGEFAGPASIREALEVGRAERIGHGVRCLEDDAVAAQLRDRRIPLEVCPSSNVALGVAASLASHPLPRLRDAGIVVSVNADVPQVAGTTLAEEYARVRDAFGYGDDVLADLARVSLDASFAPAELRQRLQRAIDAWLAGPDAPISSPGTGLRPPGV